MSEADCLFCKIAAGEIPAEIVKEGPDWVAFRDISPQAPTHVLIIPREHIATLNDVDAGGAALLGQLLLAAKEIAAGSRPNAAPATAAARIALAAIAWRLSGMRSARSASGTQPDSDANSISASGGPCISSRSPARRVIERSRAVER